MKRIRILLTIVITLLAFSSAISHRILSSKTAYEFVIIAEESICKPYESFNDCQNGAIPCTSITSLIQLRSDNTTINQCGLLLWKW